MLQHAVPDAINGFYLKKNLFVRKRALKSKIVEKF